MAYTAGHEIISLRAYSWFILSKNMFVRSRFYAQCYVDRTWKSLSPKCYNTIKSNQIFHYTRCYAEEFNEFAWPISALLRLGNTASFEETLKRWWAVGNSAFDLFGAKFEP